MANTAKARGLGAELRDLRKQAGMTVRDLEDRLDMSRSTISRIERGDKVPDSADLGAMLAIFKVTARARQDLVAKARDADEPNWTEIGHPGIPRQLSAVIEFEREATRISMVALQRVPGILQTKDYARAVLRAGDVPEPEVEALVAIRLGRQEILTRPEPVELGVVLDEAVLCRPVGGREVMGRQLRQVLDSGAADNVTVQVVPFSAGGHIGQDGSHVLYEFELADPIVHLEHRRSGQFLDEPEDTSDFRDLTAKLQRQALSAADSAELIRSHLAELESR